MPCTPTAWRLLLDSGAGRASARCGFASEPVGARKTPAPAESWRGCSSRTTSKGEPTRPTSRPGSSPTPTTSKPASGWPSSTSASSATSRRWISLLEITRRNRKFGDDIGRKTVLALFDLLGSDHEIVSRYRRLLAAALH